MRFVHERKTETHFERSTQEEIFVGRSRVRRQLNERRATSEMVDERVEVDDDWMSVDMRIRRPTADKSSIHAHLREQLGSG